MIDDRSIDELDRLASRLCDGSLTEEEAGRLDAMLSSDEVARRIYNNYMFLHAELYAQHASLEAVENGQSDFGFRIADCGFSESNPQSTIRNPQSARWLTIAAALVGVAAISSWGTYLASRNWPVQSAQVAADKSDATSADPAATVARITATRNCLWQEATNGIGFGSRLHAGQRLDLAAGLVEITFDDGAAVVLEGPATFDVRTRGEARLHEGRLAAVVPERAQGFLVATSRVNVIDLGTEFGLMAEPEGTTEIHVFNGLVKAQLLDESGKQVRTVELNTSEAARIQPAVSQVAKIPARDEEFVRSMSIAPGAHDGLYAYDGFNYPTGPLAEQNGGFGWAGPWFNVEADAQSDANSNGVRPSSLEYEGLVPLGNHAAQTAHQNRIRRSLGTSVGGVFDAAGLVENQDGMRLVGRDGAIVYLSFLQRVDKLADVFYGVELHRSDGNGNRVLCIGHGAEGTGYGVTSNFNVYNQRNYPRLGDENTEPNFFVVRITFGPGNRDRVEVFRNPESLIDENACIVDAEMAGNFAFDRVSLGNFHGTKVHEVDEIRVGTTFRAVTGRRSRGPDRLMPRVAWQPGQGTGIGAQLIEGSGSGDLALVSWPRTAN
ncbi:MAG: FecR family protein [Planctomycetes bacterium]|nr:FecR family protein [Planctomycetota bacterium]